METEDETLKTDTDTIRLILGQYLKDKFSNMEEIVSSTIFAEESEADTSSKGRNDIIDEGELINTTESEWSDDDYDHDDSLIYHEEKV